MNLPQNQKNKVLIVGAGLAGSDCAWFLAQHGVHVTLVESKLKKPTPAQKSKNYGELVCTNSLKSTNPHSAHGVLKHEMEGLGSLVLKTANAHSVPAGEALAVDREKFSEEITSHIKDHPLITTVDEEVVDPILAKEKYGCSYVVVATGPLTTERLESWIQKHVGEDDFYFYDAIAPVVDADTLDYSKLYFKDRHVELDEFGETEADYLNAPMNKEQYENFIDELVKAEKVPAQNFEAYKYFESCLPIDTMAERGRDTPRFSCMKPIGLETPEGERPYAVVQLRKENLVGSAYNMVGFQTRLTYKEQVRVFRMIPGLEKASFPHLGSVHRNSFINSKKVLRPDLSSKTYPELFFAGQITGVEGYTESASMGLYAGFQILRRLRKEEFAPWPNETAIGALINYIMTVPKPTPSNINFGLLPRVVVPKEKRKGGRRNIKLYKKEVASSRAKEAFVKFIERYN